MTVKPEVEFPYGDPPTELEIIDITEGDGRRGQVRRQRSACTTSGVAYSTGEEFDASYNRGDPLELPAGRRPGDRRAGTRAWPA